MNVVLISSCYDDLVFVVSELREFSLSRFNKL